MIFDDLVAEQDRLEAILDELDDEAWVTESGAAGWTMADVVLHLAQTEEMVVASARGQRFALQAGDDNARHARRSDGPRTCAERGACRGVRAVADRPAGRGRGAAGSGPAQRLRWAAAPLKPTTLATTRLAEHWAHGLDITGPLDIPFPDTDRLRHIAWLAQGSLPYAFTLVGEEPHDVFCELTAPDGTSWRYGSPDADSTITGSAGAFCRVGAQRLAPDDSGLVASGPHGPTALRVLRNYAG